LDALKTVGKTILAASALEFCEQGWEPDFCKRSISVQILIGNKNTIFAQV